MNTLIFLGGAGTGAFVATIMFLGIIRLVLKRSSKSEQEVRETNLRSVEALEVRNEIGKDQLNALREIAAELERHFSARK